MTDFNKAAKRLGALGGSSMSEAKADAARENGKKGGRPRAKCYYCDLLSVAKGLTLEVSEDTGLPLMYVPCCEEHRHYHRDEHGNRV